MGSIDDAMFEEWPGGLPAEETSLWWRLPRERKERALQRLRAVQGLQAHPDQPAIYDSVAEAAKAAGTGVSTFYAILRRWGEKQSLASLGVHATSNGPNIEAKEDRRRQLEECIRTWLVEDPDLTIAEVQDRLHRENAPPPLVSIRRAYNRIVRALPSREPFGNVCFDSAGLDVGGEGAETFRINALLDLGLGLVLGWDIAPESEILRSYKRAAEHSWRVIPPEEANAGCHNMRAFDLRGARASSAPLKFDIYLPPDYDVAGSHLDMMDTEVHRTRRVGSMMLTIVGDRLGPVWIGTGTREAGRGFRTGRMEPKPQYGQGLRALIDQAISDHNRARLALAPREATTDEAARRAAEIGHRANELFI